MEAQSGTELATKELVGRQKWLRYPVKCWKIVKRAQTCNEKRRQLCRKKNDGDGYAVEEMENERSEAEVDGQHQG